MYCTWYPWWPGRSRIVSREHPSVKGQDAIRCQTLAGPPWGGGDKKGVFPVLESWSLQMSGIWLIVVSLDPSPGRRHALLWRNWHALDVLSTHNEVPCTLQLLLEEPKPTRPPGILPNLWRTRSLTLLLSSPPIKMPSPFLISSRISNHFKGGHLGTQPTSRSARPFCWFSSQYYQKTIFSDRQRKHHLNSSSRLYHHYQKQWRCSTTGQYQDRRSWLKYIPL